MAKRPGRKSGLFHFRVTVSGKLKGGRRSFPAREPHGPAFAIGRHEFATFGIELQSAENPSFMQCSQLAPSRQMPQPQGAVGR